MSDSLFGCLAMSPSAVKSTPVVDGVPAEELATRCLSLAEVRAWKRPDETRSNANASY